MIHLEIAEFVWKVSNFRDRKRRAVLHGLLDPSYYIAGLRIQW